MHDEENSLGNDQLLLGWLLSIWWKIYKWLPCKTSITFHGICVRFEIYNYRRSMQEGVLLGTSEKKQRHLIFLKSENYVCGAEILVDFSALQNMLWSPNSGYLAQNDAHFKPWSLHQWGKHSFRTMNSSGWTSGLNSQIVLNSFLVNTKQFYSWPIH